MNQVTDKTQALDAITFGPVPSRRLGRSLGVNNIPAKVCSYPASTARWDAPPL